MRDRRLPHTSWRVRPVLRLRQGRIAPSGEIHGDHEVLVLEYSAEASAAPSSPIREAGG